MTTRVLIAVLAVYAAAVSQAQARSMLQDAEAATCQMAGICGECGLSPLTLDATTSKLRNFGPGVTAYMCFVNAAVDDFTIDVMGESVTGACSFRGSMNSDGTYLIGAQDDTCSLAPGCIVVKAKGACVEVSHTCSSTLPSLIFRSQKCSNQMLVASAASTEPACKTGWCGKCDKECPPKKQSICSASCTASGTAQCTDNVQCSVKTRPTAIVKAETEVSATCPQAKPEPVKCPPCKCECSCKPSLEINGMQVATQPGVCTVNGVDDGQTVTPKCPAVKADVKVLKTAVCDLKGDCSCTKTGSCKPYGNGCQCGLVTCPKSGGYPFHPCSAPDCKTWTQDNSN